MMLTWNSVNLARVKFQACFMVYDRAVASLATLAEDLNVAGSLQVMSLSCRRHV
jgi:hypothetical protein